MLSAFGETCVCSNCFSRPYKLYDTREIIARRRISASKLSYISHPTPEEIQSIQLMWKRYLGRTRRSQKSNKSLLRHRKTPFPAEETMFVNEMRTSEVFWESPKRVDERVQIANVTPENFWDFIYQNTWKGRIRVCEGELMYKIAETLSKLVREKAIGSFNSNQLLTAEGNDNSFGKNEIQAYKVTIIYPVQSRRG